MNKKKSQDLARKRKIKRNIRSGQEEKKAKEPKISSKVGVAKPVGAKPIGESTTEGFDKSSWGSSDG